MALKPEVKTMNVLVGLNADTAAGWTSTNPTLVANALYLETDTKKIKLGTGAAWADTAYMPFSELTPAQLSYISKAGAAEGFVFTDANNKISMDQLPDDLTASVTLPNAYKWVENIPARDALGDIDKKVLILVADATGDPTVKMGSAFYIWNATANGGVGEWKKTGETESLDIDYDVLFNKNTNTADDIKDGTTKVMMTKEERTIVADTVQYSQSVIVKGLNATEVAALYAAA